MDNQAYCRKYTKTSKSNFYYSFLLLPNEKRKAIYCVYAFSRLIDDIVDEGKDENQIITELSKIREDLDLAYNGGPKNPILKALSSTAKDYKIPKSYFDELIEGVEMDLHKKRYYTFPELEKYCYHVASVVGLICIEIFGYKNEKSKDYAINLGKALQLTNIMRDLKVDAQKGRIYIPREDMNKFKYSEQDLLNHSYNDSFKSLMTFQAGRAEKFYQKAFEALPLEDTKSMYAAQVMGNIYHQLLNKIISSDYDVFKKRIKVPTTSKVFTFLQTYAKNKLGRS